MIFYTILLFYYPALHCPYFYYTSISIYPCLLSPSSISPLLYPPPLISSMYYHLVNYLSHCFSSHDSSTVPPSPPPGILSLHLKFSLQVLANEKAVALLAHGSPLDEEIKLDSSLLEYDSDSSVKDLYAHQQVLTASLYGS